MGLVKQLPAKPSPKYFFTIGVRRIDYIKILNINKIFKPYKKKNKYRIFVAYYLGSTRLIDNI